MLRRVQCTFPSINWLVVVPAAIALASCGGSIGGDSVTGVSIDEVAAEAGVVEAASASDQVLLCHRGSNKWVPEEAVGGHLGHGDTVGPCPRVVTCPCFSAGDIQAAAGVCDTSVSASCSTDDPYYLALSCDPGGNVPPGILGIFLSQTAEGGYCYRDDIFASVSQNGLSDAEYQACVNAINGSGYCT